jgi:C4-dicarboxylate-specific signal transduction histidine kinase
MPPDLDALIATDDPREACARLARLAFALQVVGGLADLAHDLRSPLHSLTMAVSLLAEGAGEPKVRETADSLMGGATRRIEKLIGGLDFPDFDEREARPLVLGDLVERTLGLWPLLRLTKHRPVDLEIPSTLPAVRGSDAALRTALLHLLQNACEAQADPALPPVRLAAVARGSMVVVSVRDHGPGLGPADPGSLFVHGVTTKSRDAHLGVGLGVARTLLDEIGGTLELTGLADEPGTLALVTLAAAG